MFFRKFIKNDKSNQIVDTVIANFKTNPIFSKYSIKKEEESYGIISINISHQGNPINKFMFCPNINESGNIGSICIYGIQLEGHYNSIRSSGKIFGLNVTNVELDNSGLSPFVEATL